MTLCRLAYSSQRHRRWLKPPHVHLCLVLHLSTILLVHLCLYQVVHLCLYSTFTLVPNQLVRLCLTKRQSHLARQIVRWTEKLWINVWMYHCKVEQSTLKENKMLCTVIKQCCEAESICDDKPPSAPLPLSVSSSSPLVSYLHLLQNKSNHDKNNHRIYIYNLQSE